MCSNSWPKLLDLSRDEGKRILRRLELEGYCGVITAFRAQGDLTKEKKRLLRELQATLSISTERHRAEVRRAVNDEKLTTIADHMAGPDVSSEWLVEGRRLIPLMPRLVPQTAFTVTANNAANMQAEKNLSLPSPALTGSKEGSSSLLASVPSTPSNLVSQPATKVARPGSPTTNVVVLPSGTSIHIKGGLNTDEEDIHGKKHRRSSSSEGLVVTKTTPASTMAVARGIHTATTSGIQGISPMKITFTKSPAKSHTTTVTPSQKVILVSSSAPPTPTVLQRSISMPVVKSSAVTMTTSSLTHPKASVVMPSASNTAANGNLGNIVTVATSGTSAVRAGGAQVTQSHLGYITTSLSAIRPRTKTITTRPKMHQVPGGRPGIVFPVGSQTVAPSPQTLQNIHVKQVNKPTIQIKQEGGMKIITQGLPPGASKLLPKPVGSSGSPVVMVTSATSGVSMVTKSATGYSQVGSGRILNITTQGGKVITATASRSTTANVVTVNPKTLQLTAIKGSGTTVLTTGGRVATATGSKPNVIVVQKAQPKRSQTPTTTTISVPKTPPGAANSPFEKELMSFIQKQDSLKQIIQTKTAGKPGISKGTEGIKKQVVHIRQKGDLDPAKSSLLAELIQAVGISPPEVVTGPGSDANTAIVVEEDSPQATSTSLQGIVQADSTSTASIKQGDSVSVSGNQWVEYDTLLGQAPSGSTDAQDASAIKALLELQSNAQTQARVREGSTSSVTMEGSQIQSQVPVQQAEYLTFDESGNLLSQTRGEIPTAGVQEITDIEQEGTTVMEVPIQLTRTGNSDIPQVLGELDPQTGIFYATSNSTSRPTGTILASGTQVSVPSRSAGAKQIVISTVSDSKSKPMDFLSSALTQAQIDLEPYQFIEEEESSLGDKLPPTSKENQNDIANTGTPLMSILSSETGSGVTLSGTQCNTQESPSDGLSQLPQVTQAGNVDVESPILSDVLISQPSTRPSQTIPAKATSFIPIIEAAKRKASTITVVRQTSVQPMVSVSQSSSSVAVAVESSGLDPTALKMEDFTSQQLEEKTEYVFTDEGSLVGSPSSLIGRSGGGGSGPESLGDNVRLSKRKRKPPPAPDDSPPQSCLGGWVRHALSLMQRVSRYRGANKEKGELSAASWFTRPVDPGEAPGYYDIIKSPMDFGTIKRKLEAGSYAEWENFHRDMMLVRDNCHTYNPPGHEVRRDCDEVFAFYQSEYDKLTDRWQKSHVSSPVSKRPRPDKSPVRS